MAADSLKIGVLGASGYTGADLVRLLATHPNAEIRVLTANQQAGQPMRKVYPHLGGLDLPDLVKWEDADWSSLDVAFCGLPHGTTQEIVASMPDHLKVVDLSADFRLRDPHVYAEWYGHEHRALQLQEQAVYGLTELNREAVTAARLVACPGCYPTAALLALVPIVEAVSGACTLTGRVLVEGREREVRVRGHLQVSGSKITHWRENGG